MEYALFGKLVRTIGRKVDFSIDWIEGYVQDGGIIIRYSDQKEVRHASDNKGSDN